MHPEVKPVLVSTFPYTGNPPKTNDNKQKISLDAILGPLSRLPPALGLIIRSLQWPFPRRPLQTLETTLVGLTRSPVAVTRFSSSVPALISSALPSVCKECAPTRVLSAKRLQMNGTRCRKKQELRTLRWRRTRGAIMTSITPNTATSLLERTRKRRVEGILRALLPQHLSRHLAQLHANLHTSQPLNPALPRGTRTTFRVLLTTMPLSTTHPLLSWSIFRSTTQHPWYVLT